MCTVCKVQLAHCAQLLAASALVVSAAVRSCSWKHRDRLSPQLFAPGVRQSSRLAAVSASTSHHLNAAGHCEWLKQQLTTDCSPFTFCLEVLLQMSATDLCALCCPGQAPQCMRLNVVKVAEETASLTCACTPRPSFAEQVLA